MTAECGLEGGPQSEMSENCLEEQFIEAGELQRIIDDLIGKGGYSYEGEKVKKDGERFPAQILFTLTWDKNGKVVGFVEIVEDLTEGKRAEEAQAQANAARIEQLEREIRSLELLSGSSRTTVTAQTFGMSPLSASQPETFTELVQRYEDLMDKALEQRAYKVEHNISEKLRSMAEQMCFLKSGARDVVEIHSTALKRKGSRATPEKVQAYVEEGRLMVLELMGYLVSFYRGCSLPPGSKNAQR
jgi:hypothetical protein